MSYNKTSWPFFRFAIASRIATVGISNEKLADQAMVTVSELIDHRNVRHVQSSLMQSPYESDDDENYVHTLFDIFYDISGDNTITKLINFSKREFYYLWNIISVTLVARLEEGESTGILRWISHSCLYAFRSIARHGTIMHKCFGSRHQLLKKK